jgi:hypothetical protein
MLGFTYESRFGVEAWAKRFRQDFGKQPKVTFFLPENDCHRVIAGFTSGDPLLY